MVDTSAQEQHAVQSATAAFEEFLEIPQVVTPSRGVPAGGVLPAEAVVTLPAQVAVVPAEADPHHHDAMSVVLHKDELGVVRSIAVYCRCGCSALIKLDYGDEGDQLTPMQQVRKE